MPKNNDRKVPEDSSKKNVFTTVEDDFFDSGGHQDGTPESPDGEAALENTVASGGQAGPDALEAGEEASIPEDGEAAQRQGALRQLDDDRLEGTEDDFPRDEFGTAGGFASEMLGGDFPDDEDGAPETVHPENLPRRESDSIAPEAGRPEFDADKGEASTRTSGSTDLASKRLSGGMSVEVDVEIVSSDGGPPQEPFAVGHDADGGEEAESMRQDKAGNEHEVSGATPGDDRKHTQDEESMMSADDAAGGPEETDAEGSESGSEEVGEAGEETEAGPPEVQAKPGDEATSETGALEGGEGEDARPEAADEEVADGEDTEEAAVTDGEDTEEAAVAEVAELEDATSLEEGDPGDLPEPPAGREVDDLPVADVPSELGWDELEPGDETGNEEEVGPSEGQVLASDVPVDRVEAPSAPLWDVPEFEPIETDEEPDELEELLSVTETGPLENTSRRFTEMPDVLPFIDTRVMTIEQQFEGAVALLRSEADTLEGDLKAAYLLGLGRLLLGEGRNDEARQAIRDSLNACEAFAPSLRAMAELSRQEEKWDDLVDCLETQVLAANDERVRAAALVAAAEVKIRHLGELEAALSDLEDALETLPDNFAALRLLQELHRQEPRWVDYSEVSERVAGKLALEGQVLVYHHLAEVAATERADPETAGVYYKKALELAPDFAPSRVGLEILLRGSDGFREVRALYRRDAERLGDERAVYAWLEVADSSEHVGEPEATISALERALECDPTNPYLRRECQGRLARAGRWEEVVATVHEEMERSEREDVTAFLHLYIAHLLELACEQPIRALDAVKAASALQPEWRWCREELLRLLGVCGRWDELIDALLEAAESEEEPARRAGRYYQAGMLTERYQGDQEAALRRFMAACEADAHPIYAWTVRLRLEEGGLWDELADHLDAGRFAWPFGSQQTNPRIEALEMRGVIAEFVNHNDELALEFYRAAYEDGARSPISLGGIIRILRRGAKWEVLEVLFEELEEGADDPMLQALLKWERIRQLSERLERADDALGLYEDVISGSGFLPAVWLKAYGLREAGDVERCNSTLEATWGQGGPYVPAELEALAEALHWARRGVFEPLETLSGEEASRRALDLRELLLWERGESVALSDVYAERIAREQDERARAYLQLRRAGWLEAEGASGEAYEAVAQVVADGMHEETVSNRLERLAVGLGRTDDLATLYSSLGEENSAAPLDLLLRWGRVQEQQEGEREAAFDVFHRAWSDHPDCYEALEALIRLARDPEEDEVLAAAFAERARRMESKEDAAVDWLEAGCCFARVRDEERAEQALSQVLEHGLLRDRAFDFLVELYHERGDVDGLEIIYDGWISKETDPIVRQCWVMELADQLEAVGALQPALVHFERLATQEQYLPACLRLERIDLASEDWKRYAAALDIRIEAVLGEQAKEEAREIALEVRAGQLRDPWAMEQVLQLALEKAPDAPEATEAQRILLASQERWTDLAVMIDERVERTEKEQEKVRLMLDAAWLHAYKLDELDVAFDRYQDVLDIVEGEPEALAALIDISQRREDWEGMAGAIARKAVSMDQEGKMTAYREIARLWDEKLEDPESSLQSYRKVLELKPDDSLTLGAMTDLYRRLDRWEAFVETAETWLAVRRDEDPDLLNEIGETLAHQLDEPDRAVPFLLRAMARGGGDLEVLREVAEQFESKEKWIEAAELYERIARATDQREVKIDLYQRVATVAREKLNNVTRAIGAYEALLEAVTDHLPGMWALATIHAEQGQPKEALSVLDRLAVHESSSKYIDSLTDSERLAFHRLFGELLIQAEVKEEAAAHFEAALKYMPGDQEILAKLANLYKVLERWDRYAGILQAQIDTATDLSREALAERYEALGTAHRFAGDTEAALEAYGQAKVLARNRVEVYLLMAEIAAEREEWSTLLGLHNNVIKYSPEPKQVVDAYLRKADILYEKLAPSDPDYVSKAVLHYEKAVLYDRRNAYAMLRLAEIALESRQFQKAKDWLRRVMFYEPEGGQLARTLILGGVLCAEAQKNTDAALANFKKASNASSEVDLDTYSALLDESPGKLEAFLELFRRSWTTEGG